jgi:dinuclear metal center YbgI/SA1388 family protein
VGEIIADIDALLTPERFEDYCLNGLQVPGPGEVQTIATGVSANAELFELAAAEGAGLLVVHHGLFWGPGVRSVDELLARRLRILFESGIALAAYHLPLDAHPQIGNNALMAQALQAVECSPFALHGGQPIGVIARLDGEGVSVEELSRRTGSATGSDPLCFAEGPPRISSVAIVSGAGADYLADAAAAGAQALITGEPEERTLALSRELGMHLLAAGHHATERFGIRRLGEHLAERFGLGHVYLDVPNPV